MMQRQHKNRLRLQRGDTIIEVLICILIVSLILTGAYVTTNRSTLAVRDSQEHSEALKLIQSQLEQIRQNASEPSPAVYSKTPPFCMVGGTAVSTTDPVNGPKCKQDGAAQPTTQDPAYVITVQRTDIGNASLFKVRADWQSVLGTGQASEQISYRLSR